MRNIIIDSIDWFSVKLNLVCILGFVTGSTIVAFMAGIATASTIIYNAIRIYKELKNKNHGKIDSK